MRIKGEISAWNEEKGFGFITPDSGGKRIFVHIKEFRSRNQPPKIGQIITYTLGSDKHGRPCAVEATLPSDRIPKQIKRKSGSLSMVVAVLFIIILGASVFASKIPLFILGLYIVLSLLTFIIYAIDKSAAQKGAWRTQESTLHLLSLAGGWPGALIAQQRLRHKSKKPSFRFVFWITVLLNCGALAWLFTENGASTLRSFISQFV